MSDAPHLLKHARYRDLARATYDLAILPWGATEPHNRHLPYGTDIIETETIGAESSRIAAAQGARVILLPAIPFGVNTTQLDIPMTINMNPSTQRAVLQDVIESLSHHGVPKLAVLNGHGANDFKHMIRELQLRTSIFLCSVNWWVCVDAKKFFDVPGDHAGELETSLMMHIAPDHVLPLSEAGSGAERKMKIKAFREGWAWTPRAWTRVTSDTGTGNPAAATAAKGERYFRAVTETLGSFFAELARADLNSLYEGES